MLVGVIPAAGHATRLGPIGISKEVIPVRGRPVMDFLAERMRAAQVDELRVVTRPAKADVIDAAHRLGAGVVLGEPPDVSASLNLGVAGLADDDEVVFGFPDTLWEPLDGLRRLLEPLRAGRDVVLGLFVGREPERSDVVTLDADGQVAGVAVKPREPPGNLIWGCAAVRAHVIRGLDDREPGRVFDAMAATGAVAGVRLSEHFIDIGTPPALRAMADDVPGRFRRLGDGR